MKYTILINQQAIVTAGLHEKTDLVDWAILDYIHSWQSNPKVVKKEDRVWINYQHLIKQMPLLGINDKSCISRRITKLSGLSLIDTQQDSDDQRLYIKTTQLYYDIMMFQDVSDSQVTDVLKQQPVFQNNTPGVLKQPPGVLKQHSYNYQDTTIKDTVCVSRARACEDDAIVSPGTVCVEMKNQGMVQTNPAHPDLITLLKQGANLQDFIYAAIICVDQGKGFGYALGIVKSLVTKRKPTGKPIDYGEYEPNPILFNSFVTVEGERLL
jgi:hypothetical protein